MAPGLVILGAILACLVAMLPIAVRAPVASSRDAVAVRSARYTFQRWRVLVVDGNVLIGAELTRMLKEHEVTVVYSKEAALAALALDADVDAILCSLAAPEMSGFEFIDVLSERYPALRSRLVFMLGTASTPEVRHSLALTGIPWIVKPIRYASLVTRIDMAARSQRDGAVIV